MKPRHLYLTGYRGCGKSTVGKQLSTQLDLPLCDLDEHIEATAGISIAEIFAREGESGFRDRESAALTEVAARPSQIIALGGGAILRAENRKTIVSTGWCAWLDADPTVIAARLAGDHTTPERRPSLTNLPATEEILALMETRAPLYEEVSELRIDTTEHSIEEISEEIARAFVSSAPTG